MSLRMHCLVSMPFQENTYVVGLSERRDVLVIDPGLEPELILDLLAREKLTPAAILNTHGHADHIGGNAALKEAFPETPLMIGHGDAPMLTDADLNLSAPFGMAVISPQADQLLHEGDALDLAGLRLEVLEIPGHSPGHVVFVYRSEPVLVLGGDVLFRESIGRTDFPGGSMPLLAKGIHRKLFTLPDDTVVFSGHGPETTIGHEKRFNPFVGLAAAQ